MSIRDFIRENEQDSQDASSQDTETSAEVEARPVQISDKNKTNSTGGMNNPADDDAAKYRIKLEKSREYSRRWHAKHRQEIKDQIAQLKANQVHGIILSLTIRGKIGCRNITSEDDYIQILEDLLDTLKSNHTFDDYKIVPK